jgi:thymidylate synthase (FAD)
MKVKLISYSKPAIDTEEEVYCKDVQDLINYCARVSNPSNQSNSETSERLIKFLASHKHWSPFEMASACLEITTTRDIARQMLRHRSFSFQEFSQRYADPTAELEDAFVLRECRLQDTSNRQNSIELVLDNPEARLKAIEWTRAQQRVLYAVKEAYRWAIDNGIAKEQELMAAQLWPKM